MKRFMDADYLLAGDCAKALYHTYAAPMPINDYHCHVNVKDICLDRHYDNLAQVWLEGDHYKWRAMRLDGVGERYITGDAPDQEKFAAYAHTASRALGNPLYAWTHLELQRYFGVEEPLCAQSADRIWEAANRVLRDGLSVRKMIRDSRVTSLCTTDDPADDLTWHRKLRADGDFPVAVLPAFRPDRALDAGDAGFGTYIRRLSGAAGYPIEDFDSLLCALRDRLCFFLRAGCRLSDHGLTELPRGEVDECAANAAFRRAVRGERLSSAELAQYKMTLLTRLAALYHEHGLIMQLHLGALRQVNGAMTRLVGPDTGFDSVGDRAIAQELGALLNGINERGMPKTILFCLNPKDNYVLGSMIGNFADGGVAGKMQFGSAWWFNDHRDGMARQMRDLANLGLISQFAGMLTDSRSFTSYVRFEYFRRILCDLIGEWMEQGEIAPDMALTGGIVQDICYNNIQRLMGFSVN